MVKQFLTSHNHRAIEFLEFKENGLHEGMLFKKVDGELSKMITNESILRHYNGTKGNRNKRT